MISFILGFITGLIFMRLLQINRRDEMKKIIRPIINFCVIMLIIYILKLIGFYQPEHFLVYYLLGVIHMGINVIFMISTED